MFSIFFRYIRLFFGNVRPGAIYFFVFRQASSGTIVSKKKNFSGRLTDNENVRAKILCDPIYGVYSSLAGKTSFGKPT